MTVAFLYHNVMITGSVIHLEGAVTSFVFISVTPRPLIQAWFGNMHLRFLELNYHEYTCVC